MPKMRKVIFTEAQMAKIMEGAENYLHGIDSASEIPMTAYGTEEFVNNTDMDANPAVTTADNFLSKRKNSNKLFSRRRVYEDAEYDNDNVNGFGRKYDAQVSAMAADGGGKMIKNINARVNGDGTQRLNTTQVEISRLKDDKKNNPERFAKNGGDQTLKILKSTELKQKNKISATGQNSKEENPNTTIANVNKGTGKGHHDSEQANIYYY